MDFQSSTCDGEEPLGTGPKATVGCPSPTRTPADGSPPKPDPAADAAPAAAADAHLPIHEHVTRTTAAVSAGASGHSSAAGHPDTISACFFQKVRGYYAEPRIALQLLRGRAPPALKMGFVTASGRFPSPEEAAGPFRGPIGSKPPAKSEQPRVSAQAI